MKFYTVTRKGVYDRGLFGVYENIALAQKAAKHAKQFEKDDYHEFHIDEVELNSNAKLDVENHILSGYQINNVEKI